jgi:excisionase family DNA binding protein
MVNNKEHMFDTERLLIAEEVAGILRVSKDRVYELARSGVIPCVRLGRQIRFSNTALNDWIIKGGQATITISSKGRG